MFDIFLNTEGVSYAGKQLGTEVRCESTDGVLGGPEQHNLLERGNRSGKRSRKITEA